MDCGAYQVGAACSSRCEASASWTATTSTPSSSSSSFSAARSSSLSSSSAISASISAAIRRPSSWPRSTSCRSWGSCCVIVVIISLSSVASAGSRAAITPRRPAANSMWLHATWGSPGRSGPLPWRLFPAHVLTTLNDEHWTSIPSTEAISSTAWVIRHIFERPRGNVVRPRSYDVDMADRRDTLATTIDLRLADIWADVFEARLEGVDIELLGWLLRAAYGQGYTDA